MAFAMRVLRYVSAGAIGFFFLVTVMIATAQQDVITRMKSEGLSVGYSSALALRQQVKDKVAKAPGHAQSVLKLSSDLNRHRQRSIRASKISTWRGWHLNPA